MLSKSWKSKQSLDYEERLLKIQEYIDKLKLSNRKIQLLEPDESFVVEGYFFQGINN